MELRELLGALRTGWWLLVVGLVIGGATGLALASLTTPKYTSETQLFVTTTDSGSTTEVYQGSQFSQQRVSSYAELLTGEELASRVIDRLNLDTTPELLARRISATPIPNTVLLDVAVTDESPARARDVATAVGTEFTSMVATLETPPGSQLSPVKVTVVKRPELPTSPSVPSAARDLALGLVIGLLLGTAVCIARVRLDRSVRGDEDAALLAGAPVIATILRDDALAKQHVIDRAVGNRTAEAFRQLRSNLQFLNVEQPPKAIMVTSALPSEGKTTVAVNLALVLADAGRRVTIVEADLRRPKVTRYLGLVGGVGVTNILAGSAAVDDVAQTYRNGLTVIAAGPKPPNPGELLSSSNMAALIEELKAVNDYVIVDSPPLLPVADSTALATYVDGVLLSVHLGSTRKEQVAQAAATLARVGATTLGVILNLVPPSAEVADAYGYGYGYSYYDGEAETRNTLRDDDPASSDGDLRLLTGPDRPRGRTTS
jgi:receptor protein-tyrosine kinase